MINNSEPRPSGRAVNCHHGTYLLTWTTYGTWMPGDPRGFVSRIPDDKGGYRIHNAIGEPFDRDIPQIMKSSKNSQKGDMILLTPVQATTCATAFKEAAANHCVWIHAAAIMRNHIHLVVMSENHDGAQLLNYFKGVSSHRLGQKFGAKALGRWWTRHGSRRLLPDTVAIETAINYVRNQEFPLVLFDFDPYRSGTVGRAT